MKKVIVGILLISLMLLSGCNRGSEGNSTSITDANTLDVEIKYDSDVPDENKLIKVVKYEEKGVLIVNPKDEYSIDLPDWWEGKFRLEVTEANQLFVFHVSPAKYDNLIFEIGSYSKETYDIWLKEPDTDIFIINEEKEIYLGYSFPLDIIFMKDEIEYEAEFKKMVEDMDKLEDYIVYD